MHNSDKSLIIIPCGKKKIWDENPSAGRTPARYAYTSNYFKLCAQYAENFSSKWLIFSGKYGLIEPNFMVDSYDIRVKATEGFRNKIKGQLKPFIPMGFSLFVSLCGEDYSQILKGVIDLIGMKQKRIRECLEINTSL